MKALSKKKLELLILDYKAGKVQKCTPMDEWAGRRALEESKSSINLIVESLRDGGLNKSEVLLDNSVRELM